MQETMLAAHHPHRNTPYVTRAKTLTSRSEAPDYAGASLPACLDLGRLDVGLAWTGKSGRFGLRIRSYRSSCRVSTGPDWLRSLPMGFGYRIAQRSLDRSACSEKLLAVLTQH
jgi:hypothetical protein